MRLFRKSKVTSGAVTPLRSKVEQSRINGTLNLQVLEEAARCWYSLDRFRKDRERAVRYTYGDQWSDPIKVDGKTMTESEWLKEQGLIPLKNNLIHRLVETVVGLYWAQSKEPICVANDRDEQSYGEVMSTVLQVNWNNNNMSEVNARAFKEFLIGGLVAYKETYGWKEQRMDAWTLPIKANSIFFDCSGDDPRQWNFNLVGELHDYTFNELCSDFAKTRDDYAFLRDRFSAQEQVRHITTDREANESYKYADFYRCADPTRIRVIEIWRKEIRPRYECVDTNEGEIFKIEEEDLAKVEAENARRIQRYRNAGIPEEEAALIEFVDKGADGRPNIKWDEFWQYYFVLPTGEILSSGETPYEHESHPYTIKMTPYINGVIRSFVSDVIDQQRFVNHLIMTNSFTIKSSAKGALMIPEDCISSEMSYEEVLRQWARPDGAFIVKPDKMGNLPRQVSSNSTNVGLWELLRLQIELMEDVTGVQGAMQGKQGFSGQSAAMYNMQQQNATLSQLDRLETFSAFIKEASKKKVKMLQQYYTQKRAFRISGKNASVLYDPSKLGDVDFDLNIVESTQTPVVRMLANDWLMQLFQAGAVGVKELLEVGDFPFSDRLLEVIKNNEEAAAKGQQIQPIPEDIKQQIMANTDDENVERIKQAMQQ